MAAAGSVLLASLIIILGCLYDYFGGLQEKQMQDELTLAAAGLGAKRGSLPDRPESGVEAFRLTWIDAQGTYCMTRKQTAAAWKNHADREEFQQAIKNGFRGELPLFFHTDGKRRCTGRSGLRTAACCVFRSAGQPPVYCCLECCSQSSCCVDRGTGAVGAFIQTDREVGGRAFGKSGSGAPAGKRYL